MDNSSCASGAANSSRARRHKSGLQLFHKTCAKRDKLLGAMNGLSAASKAYWGKVKDEWSCLSEAEKDMYYDRVEAEADLAMTRARLAHTNADCLGDAQQESQLAIVPYHQASHPIPKEFMSTQGLIMNSP